MAYKQITIPGFNLLGFAIDTSSERAQYDVPAFWQRFRQEELYKQIPNPINFDEKLAVCTDYKGDRLQNFSYIIGYRVNNLDQIPEGMIGLTIPEAHYAVFTAKGKIPECIVQTWEQICQAGLNRTFVADFEMYKASAMDPNNAEIEIYIGIESLSQD